jgi:hypothetical protein
LSDRLRDAILTGRPVSLSDYNFAAEHIRHSAVLTGFTDLFNSHYLLGEDNAASWLNIRPEISSQLSRHALNIFERVCRAVVFRVTNQ